MTDKATETERDLIKHKPDRLGDISRREGSTPLKDAGMGLVFIIGGAVIVILAVAAVIWHWSH